MQRKKLILGILGCFGAFFVHLVIGSLYQWGIINIYITSYHKTIDQTVTLQNNVIAFPIMMLCIGLTMRLGIFITQKIHTLILLPVVVLCQSGLIFASSYVLTMSSFIVVYGVLFGLVSGLSFMVPIVQCNKYFPGKKMYVNGVILSGTGLGSVVFGLFSYNFLNPDKLSPIKGYYIGNEDIENIAQKVPQCLRWLSLLYLIAGLIGVAFISYVCIQNRRMQKQRELQIQRARQDQNQNNQNTNQIMGNIAHKKIQNQAQIVQKIVSYNIVNNQNTQQISQQKLKTKQYPLQLNLQVVEKIQQEQIKQEQEYNDQNDQNDKDKNNNQQLPLQNSHHLHQSHQIKIAHHHYPLPPLKTHPSHNSSLMQSHLHSQDKIHLDPDQDLNPQPPIAAPQQQPSQVVDPTTLLEAFKTPVCWTLVAISFFGTCGLFLLNGNYKTYVKQHWNNDQLLTIIGVMNAIGNGFSRFFWNVLFNYTGYRFVITLNIGLQIIIYSVLRFAILSEPGYLFLIFLAGVCMGGFLVMTPTVLQIIFGQVVGSNIYGFYWQIFGFANLLQFAFVSGLSKHITFNGVIYICLGMSALSAFLVIFSSLEAPWKNPQDQLRYCIKCKRENQ